MENSNFSDKVIEALSIDTVIFGFEKSKLFVLLVKHGEGKYAGQWALPGGFIKYNESVDDAAYRILTDQTAVRDIFLEELKTFGEVNRYPERRVITVAYYALVNKQNFELNAGASVSDVRWFNIHEVPSLLFDHNDILDYGFNHLKHKIQHEPIGFNLLPRKFTLLQIKELYEAILETELDKSNFRRKFINMNLLVACNEKQKDVAHRAARLYRFDESVYNNLLKKGFVFEV
ncbi:NUDIX domain-containing protein [Fulvivirga maritima]|uniref:NUDIX hydrolase n=1 Tax=Fulvivirga maritima TaxID=2904247 RepID=UPI001F38B06C|nr:NUDIX domain-containing protein [Fulvivirga maritima]UII24819.1 NUDIX domain-containing protein [Fulvivirga maritima]